MKKKTIVFEVVEDSDENVSLKFYKISNEVAGFIFKGDKYEFDICNLKDRIFELIKFYNMK